MIDDVDDLKEDPEFMGGSWYCARCGCNMDIGSPHDDSWEAQYECPSCGYIEGIPISYVDTEPSQDPPIPEPEEMIPYGED